MAKSYLSKTDFLKGIQGQPEPLDVRGLGTVLVRPLTVPEVRAIYAKHETAEGVPLNSMDLMLDSVIVGMVEPKLTEEDLTALQNAAAGKFTNIAHRIMVLSGMSDDKDLEKKAGDGSSDPTPTNGAQPN